MIQFYGCPRAIQCSYTGNYGHRRQVNRKSPERTEDDLPVPLIPSADKMIRRAEEIFSTCVVIYHDWFKN